ARRGLAPPGRRGPGGQAWPDAPGQVQLALAPVEAAAPDWPPLPLELREIDPELLASRFGPAPELVAAVLADDDRLLLERGGKRDSESPREVVVARARLADQLTLRGLAQGAHRRLGGDDRARPDGVRDRPAPAAE